MIGLICIALLIIFLATTYFDRKRRIRNYQLPVNTSQLLNEHVAFYNKLEDNDKRIFEARIKDFLANTTIRGIDTKVDDLDKLLIASGAIIPIFAFPDWRYNNISEVLVYKDAFDHTYKTDGAGRNVLGMVGDGAMHREMILSKPSLRASFDNPADGHNTVIHEFAHLIDKADGATDGIPEYLLSQPYVMPWLNTIHETIKQMKSTHHSDINLYGATNDAEFFAVLSEYFFEQPDKLRAHHPELYDMLVQMFQQQNLKTT